MHFEPLDKTHASALLTFESNNRTFFDSLIAPRAPEFYSKYGIEDHIAKKIWLRENKSALSFVLLDGRTIIARANIKNIKPNHIGEIGYRVDKDFIGQGLATQCVQQLLHAASRAGLSQLEAIVLDNNRASETVLIKNGFQLYFCSLNQHIFQARLINAFHYHCCLI